MPGITGCIQRGASGRVTRAVSGFYATVTSAPLLLQVGTNVRNGPTPSFRHGQVD